MTTLIKFLVASAVGLLFTSCNFNVSWGQVDGNGNVVEKDLMIDEAFTTVDASSGWDVYLSQGSQVEVTAETDENLLELLEVEVRGNTLYIKTLDHENVGRATSKKIYVTYVDDLKNISASSGADVYAEDTLEGENLKIDVSSGAEVEAKAMVRKISLEASSGAGITVSGGAETVSLDVSSGADIDARELKAEDVDADASSGGSIETWAGNSITANASSGGDIEYWGNPKKRDIPKSVSGNVKSRD